MRNTTKLRWEVFNPYTAKTVALYEHRSQALLHALRGYALDYDRIGSELFQ